MRSALSTDIIIRVVISTTSGRRGICFTDVAGPTPAGALDIPILRDERSDIPGHDGARSPPMVLRVRRNDATASPRFVRIGTVGTRGRRYLRPNYYGKSTTDRDIVPARGRKLVHHILSVREEMR